MKYIFLLLLCFVICVNLFFLHKNYVSGNFLDENIIGDASHYLEIAKNLKSFGVYSDNNSSVPTESATWRPPFYPFVLSVFLFISDNVLFLVLIKIIFQYTLIFFGCYLLYYNRLISNKVFLIGSFLLVEPYFLKYSYTFLSESFTASLLFLFFIFSLITLVKNKYYFQSIFSGFLCVLTHPIVVFYVFIVLFILLAKLFLIKRSLAFFYAFLFLFLLIIWPMRNLLTFDKGLFFTTSQGAALSKGWNEKVYTEFNNTDGDLGDESLNLKYLINSNYETIDSELERSKILTSATVNFIYHNGIKGNLNIVKRKIFSNFIPYPEKSKEGIIENLGTIFRSFYLLFGLFLLSQTFFKTSYNSLHFKLFYFLIYMSQTLMSILIYTGLRFNSVYNLIFLFILIYYISTSKWKKINVQSNNIDK